MAAVTAITETGLSSDFLKDFDRAVQAKKATEFKYLEPGTHTLSFEGMKELPATPKTPYKKLAITWKVIKSSSNTAGDMVSDLISYKYEESAQKKLKNIVALLVGKGPWDVTGADLANVNQGKYKGAKVTAQTTRKDPMKKWCDTSYAQCTE